jgi:hypothetical protein
LSVAALLHILLDAVLADLSNDATNNAVNLLYNDHPLALFCMFMHPHRPIETGCRTTSKQEGYIISEEGNLGGPQEIPLSYEFLAEEVYLFAYSLQFQV